MTKAELKKLTKDQLAELASRSPYNADLDSGLSKDEMVDELLDLFDKHGVPAEHEMGGNNPDAEHNVAEMVDDGEEPDDARIRSAQEANDERARDVAGRRDPKYRLIVNEQEGPEGKDPVKVSINGYVWVIKRNAEVIVPKRVVENLKSCTYTLYEPGSKPGETVERQVPRFSFQAEPIEA